jgi:ribosomal protein L40E
MENPPGSDDGSRGFYGSITAKLRGLRGKRNGILLAVVITVVFTAVMLFIAPFFILTYLLVPVVAFALPYYMGNRRIRNILLLGLLFLLVVALMTDVSYSNVIYSTHSVAGSAGTPSAAPSFQGGNVTPYLGGSGTVFKFSAYLLSPANNSSSYQIHLVVLKLSSLGVYLNSSMVPISRTPSAGGKVLTAYVYNTTLSPNYVFIYYFEENYSGTWIKTSVSTVSTASASATYLALMSSGIIISDSVGTFIFVGIFYYGLVFVFLLIRQNNRRKNTLLAMKGKSRPAGGGTAVKGVTSGQRRGSGVQGTAEKTVKKEKWVCSSCGAEISPDAEVCGNCGEKFD